ncbi:protein FAM117B-like isoform X1 [Neodiprion fabricii]|uniref:protein FAM117B-like isoform X1 n=1 Tax=Neodiprion fabricii TaxID=2872261 RepID=UPI001ED8F95A|nr:protein FAM117B-like isoform X1 [Neodiprion fabricii]
MSGSQRMRKSSPCSTSKQGPMRATLPMSSLLRQSSSLKKSNSNSPTVSPTNAWRARISPDQSSSGQRSPGSLSYKAKSKTLSGRSSEGLRCSSGQNIRRTASLDTLYLKGQWPRDVYYVHETLLSVDKSTQTEEWPNESRKMYTRHAVEQTTTEEKLEKLIRHRLQRTNKEGTSSRERTAAFGLIMPSGPPPALAGDHTVPLPSIASQTSLYGQFYLSFKASPMNIPLKPMRPPMRSSIEGLNQEIEGLVLKSGGNTTDSDQIVEDKWLRIREQITPEGHRAPFPDPRITRSVNTQTPAGEIHSSSHSSCPSSRNSESSLILGIMDASRSASELPTGGSRGSTPEHDKDSRPGTSPHINQFLAREPPDGCEKVNLKFEEVRRPMIDLSELDNFPKPSVTFQLKPSLGSAFLPLQQPASPTLIVSASPSPRTTPSTPPPNP